MSEKIPERLFIDCTLPQDGDDLLEKQRKNMLKRRMFVASESMLKDTDIEYHLSAMTAERDEIAEAAHIKVKENIGLRDKLTTANQRIERLEGAVREYMKAASNLSAPNSEIYSEIMEAHRKLKDALEDTDE